MIGWLKKLFSKEQPPAPKPIDPSDRDYLLASFRKDPPECPDCGCNEFLEGPSGGIAQNIKCAAPRCGSRFNIAIAMGGVLFVERI